MVARMRWVTADRAALLSRRPAGLVAHPQGGRQVVDEGVELDLALVGPGQVVVLLGLVDLLLQLQDAPLVLAPRGASRTGPVEDS